MLYVNALALITKSVVMKTIFDPAAKAEIINRIKALKPTQTPLWGQMTVFQMLRHCTLWQEMALGQKEYKRSFLGLIFGRIALKDMLKDQPLKPNLPTVPGFKITGDGDVVAEQNQLIKLINEQAQSTITGFMHPFFGKLTQEQGGYIVYKHIDHHLRQFGC